MRLRTYLFFIVSLLFLLTTAMTCEDSDVQFSNVYFHNRTGDTLFIEDTYGKMSQRPILTSKTVFFLHDTRALVEVPPKSSIPFKVPIVNDSLFYYQIIVYKKSTLNRYTKEYLAENNIYDKLFIIPYNKLKKMNYEIEYNE